MLGLRLTQGGCLRPGFPSTFRAGNDSDVFGKELTNWLGWGLLEWALNLGQTSEVSKTSESYGSPGAGRLLGQPGFHAVCVKSAMGGRPAFMPCINCSGSARLEKGHQLNLEGRSTENGTASGLTACAMFFWAQA